MQYAQTMLAAAPELVLVAYGVIGLVAGAIFARNGSAALVGGAIMALLIAAFLAARQIGHTDIVGFGGSYSVSPFIAFAKFMSFALAAATLWMFRRDRLLTERFEFPLLVIFACLGMGVMLSAQDLIILYMGMETLAISSYVLAAFDTKDRRSVEAGLKYFVLGAIASAIFLYGASMVYGFAGGMSFTAIIAADSSTGMVLGLVFVLVGLAFKIAAAPFHLWAPDVYQGAPLPVVTFFASSVKFATMMLMASLVFELFLSYGELWRDVLSLLAVLSMLVGSLGALRQTNLKRLLAYSSIANIGFALICVAAGAKYGAGPVLVYMSLYSLSALGVFGGIALVQGHGTNNSELSDLNGLIRTRPVLALAMSVLVFSMAGIPPAAGFFGKFAAFSAGLEAGLLWLVICGIVASVISLAYYLRLIWSMFMVEPRTPSLTAEAETGTMLVTLLSALALFPILVLWAGWLWRLGASLGAASF